MKARNMVAVALAAAVTATAAQGVAVAATAGAAGPALSTGRADPAAEAIRDLVRQGFPGVVAKVREGTSARTLTAGVADLATGAPAEPRHRFRIASNTKAFTATVLLQLEGEGRLSTSDTVERWLPGVVQGNGNDGSGITIRQLLDHTSGLYDPASTREFFAPYLEQHRWGHVIPPREVVRRAVAHPPDFGPGTDSGYSNTNYLLAGMIIEAATGNDAPAEIRTRLLEPLGLRDTTFPVLDPFPHGPHLRGYDLSRRDVSVFSPSYDWTAGAMVSTVDDVAAFQSALLAGRLLGPEQQEKLLEVAPGGHYSAGLETGVLPCPSGELRIWGGIGAGPGYYSVAMSTADGRRQVVLALNSYDLGADVDGAGTPMPADPLPAVAAALCPRSAAAPGETMAR